MFFRTLKFSMTAFLGAALLSAYPAFACSDSSNSGNKSQSVAVGVQAVSKAIKASPSAVVAFHSNSCGTCKVQKPRLQTLLLKEQNSLIKNVFLDFDAEIELRKSLKVAYPSTVIVFKNGSEVARVTGETNESELQKLLSKGVL